MHPSCKFRKENFHLGVFYGVVGSYKALYLVHWGYQQGPGASSTPSPLHPCTPILAAIYLDGLPTLIIGMISCATACLSPVLVPIAQPHQRVKACGSTTGAHACMCPRVQACQCSLCVVFAIVH